MDWYLPLKLVHVLSAIVAVGTNVTYFVWLGAMKGRAPTQQTFALDTIKKLDARLANPAYGVLPLTGVIMVLISDGLGFTTFWIAVAIGLYVLVGRDRRRVLRSVASSPDGARGRGRLSPPTRPRPSDPDDGILTMLPVAGILYLMVMKPTP